MIGTEEVLEARNSASGSTSSRRWNSSRLAASFSTIASIAASAPSRSSTRRGVGDPLGRRLAVLRGELARPRAAVRATSRSALARAPTPPSSASTTVTSTPARAHTSAMPEPIIPPPITPIRMAGTLAARPRRLRGFGQDRRTTQTQLGSLLEPGRTMRPAPRSRGLAAWRARPRPHGRPGAARRASRPRASRCRSRRTCVPQSSTGRPDVSMVRSRYLCHAVPSTAGRAVAEVHAFEESPDITGQGGR